MTAGECNSDIVAMPGDPIEDILATALPLESTYERRCSVSHAGLSHPLRDHRFRITDRVLASIERTHLAGLIPRLGTPILVVSETSLVRTLWLPCVRSRHSCIDGK
jgi:hypothetical protein